MKLILDAWEDFNHAHVVYFLPVTWKAVVFFDSLFVGEVNQTA